RLNAILQVRLGEALATLNDPDAIVVLREALARVTAFCDENTRQDAITAINTLTHPSPSTHRATANKS
ncbi:MAG: hypothetical protein ACI8RZ_005376, partial [Myxococcota bacterium]